MKMNLKHIQSLDILLKYLVSTFDLKYTFNIVIKIDNQYWNGDFVYFRNRKLISYCDNLTYNELYLDYFLTSFSNFNTYKYSYFIYSTEDEMIVNHFLLKELVKDTNIINFKNLSFLPALYNASNTSTNTHIPFLNLYESEYNVVSLLRTTHEYNFKS